MSIRGRGHILVDWDGTLYTFEGNGVRMGKPIPHMVGRVKAWLDRGRDVRIFTARASYKDLKKREAAIAAIEQECLKVFGKILPVTNAKDFEAVEIWDDKAIQVIRNTGLTYREVNSKRRHRVTHTAMEGLFNGR